MMISIVLVAQLSLGADPYELTHTALRSELYRTATVLVQELAYRSKNTERTRAFFSSIHESLPDTIREPYYSYGYLWPHWVQTLTASPEETRTKEVRKAIGSNTAIVELWPAWMILRAETECIDVLRMPRFGRTLEPRRAVYSTSEMTGCVSSRVADILSVAEGLECRRLVAALLCDCYERRDAKLLEVVEKWPAFQIIQDEAMPPGCDTLDIDWIAFYAAIHKRGRNIEVTFGELLRRGLTVSRVGQGHATPQVHCTKMLDLPAEAVEIVDEPFSEMFSFVCYMMGVGDHTNWDALRRGEVPVDSEFSFRATKGIPARVVLQRMTYRALGDSARISTDDNGGVILQRTD